MKIDEFLNTILEAYKNKLPFSVFRYPESNRILAYVQKNKDLYLDKDFETSGFVMAPFDSSEKAVIFPSDKCNRFSCDFDLKDIQFDHSSIELKESIGFDAKRNHLELVAKAIARIQEGDCSKIVVSRFEEIKIAEVNILKLLKKLILQYSSAFVYIWSHPKIGMWAGATPETLLHTKGENFKTMSLAGTQKYEGKLNVKWGAKEIEEQRLVTHHIEEVLRDLSVDVSETYTLKAGNLLHLCNDIRGKFGKEFNLKRLINKLHPTSAVCGFPRSKAMEFIQSQEYYKRGFYTGFLGEINLKKNNSLQTESVNSNFSKLFVNLRCMQLNTEEKSTAKLYIGGGITAKSDPDSEWLETVQKSLVMKSVLS